MYRIFLPLLLLLSSVAIAQKEYIDALTKMNQDWLNSYITKDAKTLSEIFADDFTLISHKGIKFGKNDVINNLQKLETVSINVDSLNVQLLTADVGIVTVYSTFVLKSEGKNLAGKNCYQDVYVKRRGRWYVVAAHVTLLSMN